MSNYGNPPSDPYGQSGGQPGQEPYGQPAQPAQDPYAQPNPYGAQPYGQVPGVPPGATFASWGSRVGAYLIDGLLTALTLIPLVIGIGISAASAEVDPITQEATMSDASAGVVLLLGLISVVLYLAFFIWNYCIKQGRTGYTIGKGILGIKLVKAETGQPIGAGMAFVRYIVGQLISSFTCGIGGLLDLLWPLWDAKSQTLHDKVVSSYVINQPRG